MPEKRNPDRAELPAHPAFAVLGDAWEALFRANEAFIAVDQTGSKEYARVGASVLKSRALAFARALDDWEEATSG
jgi:hypothetical protein